MSDTPAPMELIDHLCRNSRLTEKEAQHVVDEVLAFFNESPESFLRQRHQELQALGHSNTDIYTALQRELQARRFTCKPMSTRQIRRAIYG